MSRNSKNPNKFENEKAAAEWFDSPAGQRHAGAVLRRSIKNGTVKVVKGAADPKAVSELLEKARVSMTQPVSLRIPVSDLDAAKRIAEEKGIGYQTVLKQIIGKALQRS